MTEKDNDMELENTAENAESGEALADESNAENNESGAENSENNAENSENGEQEESGGWKFEASAPTLEKSLDLGGDYEIDTEIAEEEPEGGQDAENQAGESEKVFDSVPQGDEEFREKSKKAITVNKKTRKIILIAVACVLAVGIIAGACYALFFVPNNDERMTPGNIALTIGGEDISVGMYNYYYNSVVDTYVNYAQQGYLDLNPSEDYASQMTTDDDGNEITWLQRFENDTISQLQFFVAFYKDAVNAGTELTDDQKKSIEENIKSIEDKASEEGKSADQYIEENFGKYCGLKTLRKITEQSGIYQNYYFQTALKLSSTEDEVKAYFDKNREKYKAASFAYLEMPYNSKEDDLNKIKKEAQDYCKKIKSLDDMKALVPEICKSFIDQYVSSGYFEDEKSAISALQDSMEYKNYVYDQVSDSFNKDIADWIYSADTKVGDSTYFVDEEFNCVEILLKTAEPKFDETEYYSVRHILVFPGDGSENDESDETQESGEEQKEYTEEEWKQGLERAEKILAEYNKGEKTEAAFAQLAEKYSEDVNSTIAGGYNNYGGQIFNTSLGQMVPEFEKWSTDDSRKYGDVDIVKSDYGYHIMYFVSDWPAYLCNAKSDSDYEKQLKFVEECEIERHAPMDKTFVAKPIESED